MGDINLVSQFLAVLLGIAIGILVQDIITQKDLKFSWERIKDDFKSHITPFILSFIAIFALIEYWRVTNSTEVITNEAKQAWILYIDLLLFLTAFISLKGYGSSISRYVLAENPPDIKNGGFSKALGRSTSFLGAFMLIGLVRYWLTIHFVEDVNYGAVIKQIFAHGAGIILSIIACLAFWKENEIYWGFIFSSFGLVVVVLYFIFNNIFVF